MNNYDFNTKGIIEINSPDGILKINTPNVKDTLLRISAINVLRREGKNVASKIKDDKILKKLIQKIPKDQDIEIISYKVI